MGIDLLTICNGYFIKKGFFAMEYSLHLYIVYVIKNICNTK
jgi:hypothetical protein